MPVEETRVTAFDGFVVEVEGRLRQALTGALGSEIGREAAAEALAYGWEHWSRVREMENPAGYLYRVGLNWGRKRRGRRPVVLPPPPLERIPWVEPGLPKALRHPSEKQRIAVYLVHGHEWSLRQYATYGVALAQSGPSGAALTYRVPPQTAVVQILTDDASYWQKPVAGYGLIP